MTAPYITVAFSTKYGGFLGAITRFFGRSRRHSHIMLVRADGKEIIESTDARFYSVINHKWQDGVRRMSRTYLVARDNVEIRKIYHPHPAKVWTAALLYEGREYDNLFSLGYFLHNDAMQDSKKMSCTELIDAACRDTGQGLFPSWMGLPSVRDFYLLSHEL